MHELYTQKKRSIQHPRVGRQELSNPHPAADVAVPETGTLRRPGQKI